MVDFSVIIPAFNAENFLEKSVASVQAQTVAVSEIIIVDDASTDGTLNLARQLAHHDPRIRTFHQPLNRGPGAARNRAIGESTIEWIALLDADDLFERDRLEHLAGAIDRLNGKVDMVSDLIAWVKKDSIERPDFRIDDLQLPLTLGGFIDRSRPYLPFPDLGLLKPVIRRRLFSEAGLMYGESERHGEDFTLIANALAMGARYWVIPERGYLYTDRSVGTSRTKVDYRSMREIDIERKNKPEFRNDKVASEALDRRIEALFQLELEVMPLHKKLLNRHYKETYWHLKRLYWNIARKISQIGN